MRLPVILFAGRQVLRLAVTRATDQDNYKRQRQNRKLIHI